MRALLLGALSAYSLYANGLLVYRAGGKIQFLEVVQLSVNGKDKLLVLGNRPAPPGPGSKLASIKIGDSLLRDGQTGVMAAVGADGSRQFVYPEGFDKKQSPPPAEAWKSVRLVPKKTQSDKAQTELAREEFIGYLSGGIAELAELCMDDSRLAFLGGAAGGFPVQLELTAASVGAFRTNAAMAVIDKRIVDFMRIRTERFESGVDSAKSLDEGLRFAELSAKVYPDSVDHDKYRKLLALHKSWLERRVAILKTLATGGRWDSFILAYKEFEKHQQSFPPLVKLFRQALQESRDSHRDLAKERLGRGEYFGAWSELRISLARHPSNPDLQKQTAIAWTEYSRQLAVDQRSRKKELGAGELESLKQSLHFAARYKDQNKLDEALASVLEGEKMDPHSLPMLLTKAEILGARQETVKALAALDEYDKYAVDEERAAGAKLRNELLFQLTNSMIEIRKQAAAAWAAGKFHQTLKLAKRGLLADDRDPEVLYYGGLSAFSTRKSVEGAEMWKRFLEVSNTLDGSVERRTSVAKLLSGMPAPLPSPKGGAKNWLSGVSLPDGVYYCPVSLAFQPRVDKVQASNKLSLRFFWNGEKIQSIAPVFEKSEKVTGEKPAAFAYHPLLPHLAAVDASETAPALPQDPDELLRAANLLLLNNSLVDPRAVQHLTGKQITVGVAGNKFFHPFVWERPYFFRFEYDSLGRVSSALEIVSGEGAAASPVLVKFEWDQLRLTAIKAYATLQGKAATPLHERTMQYAGDKLVGELVKASGKTSKIKYIYTGNQLTSAECEKDESLDSRSRTVSFLPINPAGKPR